MDLDSLIAKAKANKKILIPAAAIGGVAAIYVLSKSGGIGGAVGTPPGTDAGQEPPPEGGSGGFAQAIQALQDQLAKLQTDYQGGIEDILEQQAGQGNQFGGAIQSLTDQFNNALAAQQGQIDNALSGLSGGSTGFGLDQLGGILSGLQGLNYTQFPGYNPDIANHVPTLDRVLTKIGDRKAGSLPNLGSGGSGGGIQTFNNLTAALKARTTVPRQNYAAAISRFNSSIKQVTSYAGTRRGGGSSFVGSISRPDFSSFNRAMGAIYNPKTPTLKKSGGGGSGLFKG